MKPGKTRGTRRKVDAQLARAGDANKRADGGVGISWAALVAVETVLVGRHGQEFAQHLQVLLLLFLFGVGVAAAAAAARHFFVQEKQNKRTDAFQ